MTKITRAALLAALAGAIPTGGAIAASAINLDSEPRTIGVTEGGTQSEIVIAPGDTAEFCPAGCFVRMPDGDIEVLTGLETIEISGGIGRIR